MLFYDKLLICPTTSAYSINQIIIYTHYLHEKTFTTKNVVRILWLLMLSGSVGESGTSGRLFNVRSGCSAAAMARASTATKNQTSGNAPPAQRTGGVAGFFSSFSGRSVPAASRSAVGALQGGLVSRRESRL